MHERPPHYSPNSRSSPMNNSCLMSVNFSHLDRDVAAMILNREPAVMVNYTDLRGDRKSVDYGLDRMFLIPEKEIRTDSSLRALIDDHKNQKVVAYKFRVPSPGKCMVEDLIREIGGDLMAKYEVLTDLSAFERLVPTRWVTVVQDSPTPPDSPPDFFNFIAEPWEPFFP